VKSEKEIRQFRELCRRSINPACPGCQQCADWKFMIALLTWVVDGSSELDRLIETHTKQLADAGK
jgi:hypothetical protein